MTQLLRSGPDKFYNIVSKSPYFFWMINYKDSESTNKMFTFVNNLRGDSWCMYSPSHYDLMSDLEIFIYCFLFQLQSNQFLHSSEEGNKR